MHGLDQQLLWQHTFRGLAVRIDGQYWPLSRALAGQLRHAFPDGFSGDVADDLLTLEREQRVHALNLVIERDRAETALARARAELDHASGRAARIARMALGAAIDAHTTATCELERAGAGQRLLRGLISQLPVSTGRLGAARRGWAISAIRPDYVLTFHNEAHFVSADPRRGVTAGWGATILGGQIYGRRWRRDLDEDPRETDLDFAGPWTVGHLPRTGEVYALRRCPHLPETVWLLATGLPDEVADILREHMQWMLTPNSLLLLTDALHHNPRRVPTQQRNRHRHRLPVLPQDGGE